MSPSYGPSGSHGPVCDGNVERYSTLLAQDNTRLSQTWETEVFIVQGESRPDLIGRAEQLLQMLSGRPALEPKDLAYTLNCPLQETAHRLAIVAGSVRELAEKLGYVLQRLADPRCTRIQDRSGVFYFEEPLSREGTLGFLFPGEGSQYVNMLADLRTQFPEVWACFERADRLFLGTKRVSLPSQVLFPPTGLPSATASPSAPELWEMDVAVAAVFAADHALFTLLERLEIRPHAVVGHSSGEFTALLASGAIELRDEEELTQFGRALIHIYSAMGEHIPEARFMAVGAANPTAVAAAVAESRGELYVTMDNCPHQVIVCGSDAAITRALDRLRKQGAICSLLPFNRPYHTPLYQSVRDRLLPVFQQLKFVPPATTIYSCATARPHPRDVAAIRRLAVGQWARPVRFRETVEAMYEAGVRLFVEVGPRGNLTGFVEDILRGRPCLAVPANVPHRSGITQLHHMIGLLAAHGAPMRLDHLYAHRAPRRLSGAALAGGPVPAGVSTSAENGRPAAVAGASPLRAPDWGASRARLMHQYLQTMERFLGIQREVMTAFIARVGRQSAAVALEGRSAEAVPVDSPPRRAAEASGPFDMAVSALVPGQEIIARCRLDLQEHAFLRHHTIGRAPSMLDETLSALPVVPLSVSVELMAQVAALLLPGRRLISAKGVRTHHWAAVEEEPRRTLVLTAKRHGPPTTLEEVKVWILGDDAGNGAGAGKERLLAEATMVFGDDYPPAPRSGAFPLRAGRPYSFGPEQYYRDIMFHGPLFRSVVAIDRSGDDGMEATVSVPPGAELCGPHGHPRLLTDPVLLDAAGQMAHFWAWDRLDRGFVAFPVGFESLDLYGPYSALTGLKYRTRITALTSGQICSDIDIVDPGGRLVMRLAGYYNKRFFDWSRPFVRLILFPRDAMLCTPWEAPIARLPDSPGLRCCRFSEAGDGIWVRTLAYLILNRRERQTWHRLVGPETRRTAWLLGRLVAKDAVRLFLKDRYQLEAYAADVDIATDEHERLVVGGGLVEQLGCHLSVSIAHAGESAVAVVGECGSHGGVGLEVGQVGCRPAGLEGVALHAGEQTLLATVPSSRREEWLSRLWCAKAALAKALGPDMVGSPLDLIVQDLEVETGRMGVRGVGGHGRQWRTDAGTRFITHTGREDNLVFACALVS
jgi:malonyl CoA-acyl carrier protein transacylase/phosphopantetheinyl transferase (holo-ACP synthase)